MRISRKLQLGAAAILATGLAASSFMVPTATEANACPPTFVPTGTSSCAPTSSWKQICQAAAPSCTVASYTCGSNGVEVGTFCWYN